MSNAALDWAFSLPNLALPARMLLVSYADHANPERKAWPGNERLMARTSLSIRSISKWRAELVRGGMLKPDGWAGRTLRFIVQVPEGWLWNRAEERHRTRAANRYQGKPPAPPLDPEPPPAPDPEPPEPDPEPPEERLGGPLGGGTGGMLGSHAAPPSLAPRATYPPATPKGKIDAAWHLFREVYPRVGDARQRAEARKAFPDACAAAGGAEAVLMAARHQQPWLLANPDKTPIAVNWLLREHWLKTPKAQRDPQAEAKPQKSDAERQRENEDRFVEDLKDSVRKGRTWDDLRTGFFDRGFYSPRVVQLVGRWYKNEWLPQTERAY